MTIRTDVNLKAAFEGREAKVEAAVRPEVPERIRQHAPAPVLRPKRSLAALADAVDRQVREAQDAQKARQEEQDRRKAQRRGKAVGMGF